MAAIITFGSIAAESKGKRGADAPSSSAAAPAKQPSRGQRKSWGESLGLLDSPRTAADKVAAAEAAADAKAAAAAEAAASSAPQPRTIEPGLNRPPSLREMAAADKKAGKKGGKGRASRSSFRGSFSESIASFIAVKEFETVAHQKLGVYPPKIVKRLENEEKR